MYYIYPFWAIYCISSYLSVAYIRYILHILVKICTCYNYYFGGNTRCFNIFKTFLLGDTFKDDIGIYQFGHEYSEATMKLDILGNSNSLVVMSRNNKEVNFDSYVDFLIMDQALANPIIDVVDDVGFWPVGKSHCYLSRS